MFVELHGISFSRGTPHLYIVSATIPTERTHESVDFVILSDRTILNVSYTVSRKGYSSTPGRMDISTWFVLLDLITTMGHD